MGTKRDPRVDPRPGDVVRVLDGGYGRRVVKTSKASVWYTVTDVTIWTIRLRTWRAECADAEIVKVADDGTGEARAVLARKEGRR